MSPHSKLLLFAAIALLPSAIWYWHADQVAEKFYPHHFFGAGGIRIESFWPYWQIARQTLTSSLTPLLSLMALIGLLVAPRMKYSRFFIGGWLRWFFSSSSLATAIAICGINSHSYRSPRRLQAPLAPLSGSKNFFACHRCDFVDSAREFVHNPCVLVRSTLYQSSAAQLRDAGLELKKVTPPDALIVAADMGDPTIFYYAERKGWHFLEKDAIYNGNPDDSEQAIENLERLRHRGATHFVFTKNTFWWLQSYPEFVAHLTKNAKVIEATPEFRIYELITVAR